jgi:hypothetical protein
VSEWRDPTWRNAEAGPPTAEPGEALRDPERRRAFLESIEGWLDELAEIEPPPAGLAAEATSAVDGIPDLFAVLARLAALTRETQLQGRATNRLHTELGATLNRLLEQASSQDTIVRRLAEARREARLELVAELLEARDCLARGLAEARGRSNIFVGSAPASGSAPCCRHSSRATAWSSTGSTTRCGGSTCTRSRPRASPSTRG